MRAGPSPSRERIAALEVLRGVRSGAHADRALEVAAAGLDPRQRHFLTELAYGAIRWRGRIDHHLDALLEEGLDSVPPDVAAILQLGAYQLLFMDRVPPWAAVDESVALVRTKLSRKTAGWAAGLVNGVLRNLLRRRGELTLPDAAVDLATHLATAWSHPRWMVERWLGRFGEAATRTLLERNNAPSAVHLAPNPARGDAADLLTLLTEAGVGVRRHPDGPGTLVVSGPPPDALPGWDEGRFWVQDAGAQWIVEAAPPPVEGRLLDLCAAPGTKLLGALAGSERRRALALDLDPSRLARVRENLDRLGIARARLAAADARRLPTAGRFDWVLADVPCSGTGVLGRRVDARWRRRPEDLDRLCALQWAILDEAAPRVARGGELVYATCSLESEENDHVIDAFLSRHADFRVEPVATTVPEGFRDGPYLLTRPWKGDVDGMFAARLRRVDGP